MRHLLGVLRLGLGNALVVLGMSLVAVLLVLGVGEILGEFLVGVRQLVGALGFLLGELLCGLAVRFDDPLDVLELGLGDVLGTPVAGFVEFLEKITIATGEGGELVVLAVERRRSSIDECEFAVSENRGAIIPAGFVGGPANRGVEAESDHRLVSGHHVDAIGRNGGCIPVDERELGGQCATEGLDELGHLVGAADDDRDRLRGDRSRRGQVWRERGGHRRGSPPSGWRSAGRVVPSCGGWA